ncbi:MAG: hypothetical protein KDB14_11510 [Planctomycetales bacterium]|nr:hypothetical protein [Planctomycetales bacterium]
MQRNTRFGNRLRAGLLLVTLSCQFAAPFATADEPSVSYIFPAGGQQGAKVDFHVGGHYLHQACDLLMAPADAAGLSPPRQLVRGKANLWFEGPVIPLPDSQRPEDYPWPQLGAFTIDSAATPGIRHWRVRTAQGITAARAFVVGQLPEHTEQELDGAPLTTHIPTPITINGRIYPREDVDVWSFDARRGETFVCEVVAARIGSPLDSWLTVIGPGGQMVGESVDEIGADSRVTFTAQVDGVHQVRLHDVNYRGLQDYVYRLTISNRPHPFATYPLGGQAGQSSRFHWIGANLPADQQTIDVTLGAAPAQSLAFPGSGALPVELEVSDSPELTETLDGQRPEQFVAPATLNGRITAPGESDRWTFRAEAKASYEFTVHAARIGSPLDSVLELRTDSGELIAENDDGHPSGDASLRWQAPQDGLYTLSIRDAFPARAGEHHSYRIHCQVSPPDASASADNASPPPVFPFRLEAAVDYVNLPVGGEATLEIQVAQHGGFNEPIELEATGLPEGVTIEPLQLRKNTKKAKLKLQATESCQLQISQLELVGVVRPKPAKPPKGSTAPEPPAPPEVRSQVLVAGEPQPLQLVTTLKTPFKFVGDFETKYGACGSEFRRSFRIERNGYAGPLRVGLAERQTRHLQGVTGDEVLVAPDQDEFEFTIRLAPWMEVGRTSRTCLMVVGEVQGPDGKPHPVSYSSFAQNDQIIVLVDPAPLAIAPLIHSLTPTPGGAVTVPFRVARGNGIRGAVRVDMSLPAHYRDLVSCDPVTLAADAERGELQVRFSQQLDPRQLNMPLTLRASTQGDDRYIAEAKVSF